MPDISLKTACMFKATNGYPLKLLATHDFKNFFIELQILYAAYAKDYSTGSWDDFKNKFDVQKAIQNNTYRLDATSLENIQYVLNQNFFPNLGKIFPTEIFDVAKQTYPKPYIHIDVPRTIFHADKVHSPSIYINRHEQHNLICLEWLCNMLYSSSTPTLNFIDVLLHFEIFSDGDSHYCTLPNLDFILYQLGDVANNLRQRFKLEVLMTPTPCSDTKLELDCQHFTSVPYDEFSLHIFKGKGFAENAFFVCVGDLEELLGDDIDLENSAFTIGRFFDQTEKETFCRLDDCAKIVHHYISHLWSGYNETNKNIRRGRQFMDWLYVFVPTFFHENVEFNCNEPTESTINDVNLSNRQLLKALAKRVDLDPDDLAVAIIELRDNLFERKQDKLRSELYD